MHNNEDLKDDTTINKTNKNEHNNLNDGINMFNNISICTNESSINNMATPNGFEQKRHTATIDQIPNNIYFYGGSDTENLFAWLRQFKYLPMLYKSITEHNLHIFAASYLKGSAAHYIDNLECIPHNFIELKNKLEKRFSYKQMNKTTMYHTVLATQQNPKESIKSFCEKIYNLGNEAGMEEEIIVQSMINNMTSLHKNLYKIHLQGKMTYKNLINLITILDNDKDINNDETIKNTSIANIFESNNSTSSNLSTNDIIQKLDSICLQINQSSKDNHNYTKRDYVPCKICNRTGHSEQNCYTIKRNEKQQPLDNNNYYEADKKIQRLEGILRWKIDGTVQEFTEKIVPHWPRAQEILKILPSHYKIYPTLKRNEFILNELCKNISYQNRNDQVNTMKITDKEFKYDITTCQVKIDGKQLTAIIDTGANVSLISQKLVKELNLPLQLNKNNNCITLADNNIVKTDGKLKKCTMEINDDYFESELIVLDNAAHEILLGTDFLGKYRAIVNCDNTTLVLKNRDDKDTITKIQFKTILPTAIKTYKQKLKDIDIYANEKIELKPFETKKAATIYKRDCDIPENSILLSGSAKNESLILANGIYDIKMQNHVLMANMTANTKYIEKGEKIGKFEIVQDAKLYETYEIEDTFTLKNLYSCYRGKEEDKKLFFEKIKNFVDKPIQKERLMYEHEINLTENSKIPNIKQYRNSQIDKQEINTQISELKHNKYIRESKSTFASPIILVKKKDNTKRLCIDFRALNKITIKDKYPMPRIDESLDCLNEAKYFSKIDLKSGYWQIPIRESDKNKTAFRTGSGLFEWNVMPFGLTNAPATFQRVMNHIIAPFNWIFSAVYLDDILIFSKTSNDHIKHLTQILTELRKYGLNINYNKTEFFCEKIEFLGYYISDQGITINEEKTMAISNYPTPKNKKDIQQFLGLCSYFRRFIKNFADIAYPLNMLLRKNYDFCWKKEQEEAFHTLKLLLINHPILQPPDFTKRFYVYTDASKIALGAILVQKQNEHEITICYASRSTNDAEKNYTTYELEGIAVLFALKIWRCYLLGQEFTIYTDNAALTYLQKNKDLNSRLTRWSLKFAEFNFIIEHKKGKNNNAADALSRINVESRIQIYKPLVYNIRSNIDLLDDKIDFETPKQLVDDIKSNNEKKKIILEHHFDLGHANSQTTYKSLKKYYYWRNMLNDCKEILQTCSECLIFNDEREIKTNYPLLVGEIFDRIGIDLIGPLPMTDNGNLYIVVAVEYLSKYVFLKAIKTKTAAEIAMFIFEEIILTHGCPNIILSDNGKEFKNELVEKLCKITEINKKYSSPYRPQTNGLVERTNKTLIAILSKITYKMPERWDEMLKIVAFNYNIRYQESLKHSPFEILFGRKPKLPSVLKEPNLNKSELTIERIKKISQLQENLLQLRNEEKRKNTKELKEKEKLKIGDVVLMKNQNKRGKMDHKWEGPYIVKDTNNVGSYIITDSANKLDLVVHRNNLKKILRNDISESLMCTHPDGIEKEKFEDKLFSRQRRIVDIPADDEERNEKKKRKVYCNCFYL